MKRLAIFLTTVGLIAQSAFASTTIEYPAHCKYYNSAKQLKYSGKCHGNWGVGMNPDDNSTYQRYILTYPNGSEVWIYINSNGSASVNNIPAIPIKARKGYEKVMTAQGEIFEFTEGSE